VRVSFSFSERRQLRAANRIIVKAVGPDLLTDSMHGTIKKNKQASIHQLSPQSVQSETICLHRRAVCRITRTNLHDEKVGDMFEQSPKIKT
jgi:hypothetical protein